MRFSRNAKLRRALSLLMSAAFPVLPTVARAAVPVEQIEAGSVNTSGNPIDYAPVDFGGSTSVTVLPGQYSNAFPNQTFHAVDTADVTNAYDPNHALPVGQTMYGNGSVAYPYVTDIYSDNLYHFFDSVVLTQGSPGLSSILPGHFPTGVKVINNSYATTYGGNDGVVPTTDTDAYRRLDFMINRDDVVFVSGAVSSDGSGYTYTLPWSAYNALAVSGSQTFNSSVGPGKQHADLSTPTIQSSFGTAMVSGYATALIGNAQAASQTDAVHSASIRSLLMTGADKTDYTRPSNASSGNLDPLYGAGQPDYAKSLTILQDGEKSLLTVSSNTATGTPSTSQAGWVYGSIPAAGQSAVLFQSASTITGVTASLNWNFDVTHTGTSINTSSEIEPNLTLAVCPVTLSSGHYVLGTQLSNTGLYSSTANDNVQYLYYTGTLTAGQAYAFVITGAASQSSSAALSFAFSGSFASQWNSSNGGSWNTASSWTNGIPNAQAAVANFLASPGLTAAGVITLDGNRTVGQINFNNSNSYTIATGSAGTLTIDDTGDSSGTVSPRITTAAGSHTISAPMAVVSGVTLNTASGSTLNLTGEITGSGGITKSGAGTADITVADSAGSATVNAGILALATTGSITAGTISINTSGTLSLLANPSTGIFDRSVAPPIMVSSGGLLLLATPSAHTNRQLVIASGGLTLAGSSNAWTGRVEMSSNDLDIPGASLLTITNQLKQGYNGGAWQASGGIVSATAAADSTHLTALGVILNGSTYGTAGALGTFDGYNPASTDVLIKYTYYGDANLDGAVDGSDYTLIDNGYNNHRTGWYNGDFNYDGVVDGSDYTLIDNAFNTQGGTLGSNPAVLIAAISNQVAGAADSSVPEPASLIVVMAGAAGMLRRRRTHR